MTLSRAMSAWVALQQALTTSTPSCKGDSRFTSDDTPAAALAPICAGCPIFTECAAYARAAPRGAVFGVLAGYVRRTPRQYRNRRAADSEH